VGAGFIQQAYGARQRELARDEDASIATRGSPGASACGPDENRRVSDGAWHSLVGLGTNGGQPLADGDRLALGVHLLWALWPELGFPAGGYHVWRRAHRDAEWVCLDPADGLVPPASGMTSWEALGYRFGIDPGGAVLDPDSCPPGGALHLPGQRSLEIRAPRLLCAVRAVGIGPPPLLELFGRGPDGLRLVARLRATAHPTGWIATAWATGVAACRLSGDDMRICQVCFGLPQVTGGWRRLHEDAILLPVVEPGTANDAANLHGTDTTRATADKRLAASLGRDTRRRLADAFATEGPGELVEDLLRDGRRAMLPAEATEAAGARTPPRLGMPTVQLLALTALDPDVSRMLGLYWHDPVKTGTYDYKVVAHHGGVRYPSRVVAFDELAPGPVASGTLSLDGVTFVGTAGLEVVDTMLRVDAPRIGTAAGLRLEPPVPAVTLRLEHAGVVAFAAWRGNRQVASALAFLGVATLEDAEGIDSVTWSTGPIDLREIELYEGAGLVGDLTAFAWRLSPAAPAPVHGLVLTDVAAAAEPPRLHPDGSVDAATGIVGLDWRGASPLHDAGRPVRVQVGRAPVVEDASTPPFEVRNAERPAPAFADGGTVAGLGPGVPQRWRERRLAPGSFAWSVRGIDAFGRLGEWSEAREVRVPAGTAPPPPDTVEAAYLDPADPLLTDEQWALAERDGPGLLVQWSWPAERRIAAPGVEPNGEFRVHVRRGDPNLLEGNVLAVADLGDRSRLETDCTVSGPADGLAGERLRVGGASFEVVANTGGANAAIEVAHLAAPTERPTPGPFTVQLSESSALRTDLAVPRGFGERVHVEPVGTPPRSSARIASVGDDGAVALDRPLPKPEDPSGRLVAGGIAYRILTRSGPDRVVVAAATQIDGTSVLPAAGERCTVWSGARYRAWLPGAAGTPAAHERLASWLVGVSTCDVDAVILHDPLPPRAGALPSRDEDRGPGLEGPLSRIARVSVPHRTPPPPVPVALPPEVDGDIPADRAEPADWYGRARYELAFPSVAGATGYRVLRASVAALLARDLAARQVGAAPYGGGPFDDSGASEAWLAEHHPTVGVDDLTADLDAHPDAAAVLAAWRGWSAWYYGQRSNREVMALAELPCNEEAFQPAHEGTVVAPPFTDSVDGRGLGRFVYRVRSVDGSGNASVLSAAFPLAEVRDVTPPATPVILAVRVGDNRVTVEWARGSEPDLAEYRIWRGESREAVADVRRAVPLAVVPAGTVGPLVWSDEDLPGLRTYFYRLAAVDDAGNVSEASLATAARVVDTVPPNPPAWVGARWVSHRGGMAVRLAWRADEADVRCVLQRRPMGGGVWAPVSPQIGATAPPFEFAVLDGMATEGDAYEYRVLAVDSAGNASLEYTIQPVWPE